MAIEIFPYDAAELLTDDATISAYLTVSLEEDDPAYFVRALGAVARAKNRMDDLATELGVSAATLDSRLRDGTLIGLSDLLSIARLLGVRLSANVPMESDHEHAAVA